MNGNILCSIEGNIGSGKSSILQFLKSKKYNNVVFVDEPIDLWNSITDKDGITILQHFYHSKEEFSFAFQMMAYITRLKMIKEAVKANSNCIIITERCLDTDKNIFEKMLYDEGFINDIEHKIYTSWFDEFKEYANVSKIIYVGTDPEICSKRIAKRNRTGESDMPITYLKKCHDYHQNWIISFGSPTLIIDGNQENNINNLTFNSHIDSIERFLEITQKKEFLDSALWLTGC